MNYTPNKENSKSLVEERKRERTECNPKENEKPNIIKKKCVTPDPILISESLFKPETERHHAPVSPSFKKKVLGELYHFEKNEQDESKHSSIEAMEQMMDVKVLKDGSILVKPVNKAEPQSKQKSIASSVDDDKINNSPIIFGK